MNFGSLNANLNKRYYVRIKKRCYPVKGQHLFLFGREINKNADIIGAL